MTAAATIPMAPRGAMPSSPARRGASLPPKRLKLSHMSPFGRSTTLEHLLREEDQVFRLSLSKGLKRQRVELLRECGSCPTVGRSRADQPQKFSSQAVLRFTVYGVVGVVSNNNSFDLIRFCRLTPATVLTPQLTPEGRRRRINLRQVCRRLHNPKRASYLPTREAA